ncbi:MAG: peptide-methionine (S)-S-oxide reductase MsrA [Chitinophagaceae bacterium]|nr:peptide-methionine (S)-S-oxide reductase MsrA [Chitinophagaceae bacterium]
MRSVFILLGIIPVSILFACVQKNNTKENIMNSNNDTLHTAANKSKEIATFGNGCFWCTEAVFQQLKGVSKVTSGYSGGHVANPTYEEVCAKTTGHAEAIQIIFDPAVISYDELLEVFWQTHDPTTLNRQGNDIGPQYRSVIFYHNELQKEKAEKYKAELDQSGAFANPIVTAIEPFKNFYAAEDYHQNYYRLNGKAPYCYFVIKPKLEKFEKVFKNKLKAH